MRHGAHGFLYRVLLRERARARPEFADGERTGREVRL
jgi:hypothetical protein